MTGDTIAAITKARSLLGRLQRQETRFLHGPTRTTRDRKRAGARDQAGTKKKEGSGPPRENNRHRRTNRPSWLCAPQCTRRAIVCRSSHSSRSISLRTSTRRSFLPTRGVATLRRSVTRPDVEPILYGDEAGAAMLLQNPRASATAFVHKRPSRTSSDRDIEGAASNVSVNTFVAVQVQDIMEKAANNMANMMNSSGAIAAGDTADVARVEALRRQVMRAATYTAVCRRLEHALQLYTEAAPYKAPLRRRSLSSDDSNRAERAQAIRPKATIADLPKSTLLAIFAMLDQRELARNVAPVCRQWRLLAYHRALWRHLLLDWSSAPDAGLSRVLAAGALLAETPGLLTLELVGCADVDRLLWQVVNSCHRLRSLTVDSCTVSTHLRTGLDNSPCVLTKVLKSCKNLHSLIVAFTPSLAKSSFFAALGRKCWSMRCFLVSADVTDTRIFFESASWHAPGTRSREAVAGARAAILPSPTNSTRVVNIQTESSSSGTASALLQWRRHRDHADATYFGVNVRVGLAD